MKTFLRRPTRHPAIARQHGLVLLDSLIAIVIFSIGILGLTALQASAVKLTGDAKYRTDAAMYADQVIALMWASNTTTLSSTFASPSGTAFKTWATTITGANGLPGAASTPPTISIDAANNVKVTLYWHAPGDVDVNKNQIVHQYVSITQIAN